MSSQISPLPPASERDEAAWIARAQRGDLDAFNALVLLHQDGVYTLAMRILGDPAGAADAAQETFITAYRRFNTYRGGSLRAWLLRIATNQCYDALRYRKRRPVVPFEDLPGGDSDDGAPLPDPALSPEQHTLQRETREALQRCLAALNADQRTALVLSDVEAMDYQEIADTVGVQVGTVKSRISRARAAMRDCLRAVPELFSPDARLSSTARTDVRRA